MPKGGESIKSNIYPKIFFSALFFSIILLAYFITKPFFIALLTGAITAYLLLPVYEKILAYVRNKSLASLIVVIFLVLLITVPLTVAITSISQQAIETYNSLNEQKLATNFLKIVCKDEASIVCRTAGFFIGFLPNKDVDSYLQATTKKITAYVIENASKFFAIVPSILLNFFIMIFVIYYLLKDGQAITYKIKKIMPLKESQKEALFSRFHDVTYAVFYGNISIAVLQGLLGALGFLIFGVSSPLLWGFVMILFALIPYFGTAIIWLPAALNLIFMGYLQPNNSLLIKGILLIAYGIIVISSIDNILKPKLIGKRAAIHPILVLLGVLGGLNLFGFMGLILGPVMLSLLMTFVDIYQQETKGL